MLKSTYKPSASAEGAAAHPLPPGWTEHKAPAGQPYYHNASTGETTYRRPGVIVGPVQPIPQLQLSDPRVANAFMAQMAPRPPPPQNMRGGGFSGRGGRDRGGGERGGGRRPQPADKPVSKAAIPGCEPWLLVYTKYGRRFAYNPTKNASFWRIPDKLKAGILVLDQARIREKAGLGLNGGTEKADEGAGAPPAGGDGEADGDEDASSDYEELEVTEDEDGPEEYADADSENPSKRQRTQEPAEFDEDDIAFQLQAMGAEYGLEPGDYDDGNMDEWPEGTAGAELTHEDARALFKDLLNDYRISPFSPWEKLLEDGKVFDDPRYTVLTTMADRRDAWEEWSREKIKLIREQRALEEKKDPRISFMAFLHEKATPKLYWAEFKRKHRKEDAMKSMALTDKDREKWYREHVARLKLPHATLKADLTALLRSIPLALLHNQTDLDRLPAQILTDVRYISLDAATRDALVDAFIQSLPPPPEDGEKSAAADDEQAKANREARARREKALREREMATAEEQRLRQKELAHAKMVLRDGERELERAMGVSNRGLQNQLLGAKPTTQASPARGEP